MSDVVIIAAARTPVGSFQGSLASIPAPKLGATALRAACERACCAPTDVDEVIMGNVLSAGQGQAPARQAAIYAGLPTSVRAVTVNKVCGSGLKAVTLAVSALKNNDATIIAAGGMENMSRAPFAIENARSGLRLGHQKITDLMIQDGLWDPYNDFHMGNAAELCVKKYNYSRETQDEFARGSFKKALAALERGDFRDEIVPVEVSLRKGQTTRVDTDEGPKKVNFEKIPTLKPVFDPTGTVTAANASSINDGAAAVVLMREQTAQQRKAPVLGKVVAYAEFAQDPEWFTTAPVGAINAVLKKAGMRAEQVDLWEINEAFAVVTMAAIDELKLDPGKVNIRGGAIALGHPIGASGARLLVTLLYALKKENKRYGLVTLCIGGGEAIAMIVEHVTVA